MGFKKEAQLLVQLIIIMFLFFFLFGCSSAPEPGTIKGIVIEENSSKVYEGATVIITDVGGEQGEMHGYIVEEIKTDSEGKFEVKLEVGSYSIEAWYGNIDHRNKEPVYIEVITKQVTEVTLKLPANDCLEMQGCEQFHCLFPECWCDELTDDPIIYKSGRKVIVVKDAKEVVEEYFEKNPDESNVFYNSVYLGDGWFNLFYGDDGEEVYTVGPEGNVYMTQCGV